MRDLPTVNPINAQKPGVSIEKQPTTGTTAPSSPTSNNPQITLRIFLPIQNMPMLMKASLNSTLMSLKCEVISNLEDQQVEIEDVLNYGFLKENNANKDASKESDMNGGWFLDEHFSVRDHQLTDNVSVTSRR